MSTALDWARRACDTMMRTYKAEDLPPKGRFFYHQGVFLSGMNETYKLCGDEKYFNYIKAWVDAMFDSDGKILNYKHSDLDDMMAGILLFPILDKTGDPFYKKCIESVIRSVRDIRKNDEGGFWHQVGLPGQMWVDGLYMAGPLCAELAARIGDGDLADEVVHQVRLMEARTRDPKTGLWYHAYDSLKKMPWADPVTGCSSEFWGRAIGWAAIAIPNDLDSLPKDHPGRTDMIAIGTRLLTSLCRFQSPEGRWYEVVDKVGQPGNWPENSCTSLYIAGICKAVRQGWLDPALLENARRGYDAVIADTETVDGNLQIRHVCIGTCVGDYAFYCARPTSTNDLHGVGAFLLMCAEVQRLMDAGKWPSGK